MAEQAGPDLPSARLRHVQIEQLAGREALQRLELLASVSHALDRSSGDYEEATREVAALCVPAFADLCAIEMIGRDGELRTVAYKVRAGSSLHAPDIWAPILLQDMLNGPLLIYEGNEPSPHAARALRELNATSIMMVPVSEGRATTGCFIAATGTGRRAFRTSAVKVGAEISSRLAATLARKTLHHEVRAASMEQARALRRLRWLSSAAARLAAASTAQGVLQLACAEARTIGEADGAMARWWMPDGSVIEGRSGQIDEAMAQAAFEATGGRRVARGDGWVAYPLMPNQVRRQAALAVFVKHGLSADDELVFASLVSLVPVAVERSLGSGAALAQEARVRNMVSTSPVALVGFDSAGELVLANPAAQRLFGWGRGQGRSKLPPSLQPAFAEVAELVRSTGDPATIIVSDRPFELSLSAAPMPVIAGDDNGLSVLVAAVDLSEVKRAERALVQAQKLDAMGQVAGRVAHDFNNVLTVILGYAALLSRNPSDVNVRLAAENISKVARRATSLTQQLLGLGGQRADPVPAVDLAAELREMKPVLERMAGKRVRVTVETPRRGVIVRMSPGGAEQLVLNLALNACQAMEQKGRSLAIRLSIVPPEAAQLGGTTSSARAGSKPERSRAWAVLNVVDDGPGMSKEVLERCMEPFFTTKDKAHGTGLGLPTVYALVNEGGGQIQIDSRPGTGTTVTVRLPLGDAIMVTNGAPEPQAWAAGEVLSGRALLVEDEGELRHLAGLALEQAGIEVTKVRDAEAAQRLVKEQSAFDVLVSDVTLPGRSGLELAEALGAGRANLPVLFVTGYSSEESAALPVQSQYVQVLDKPYSPEELVFAVAALLGAARGGSEEGVPPAQGSKR